MIGIGEIERYAVPTLLAVFSFGSGYYFRKSFFEDFNDKCGNSETSKNNPLPVLSPKSRETRQDKAHR